MENSLLYEKCKQSFTSEQMALLEKAIAFARDAHRGQKRESGEDYFIHPEAVAVMLYDLGMDSATIIAGLLHDVVEDGEDITVALVSEQFGSEIATMVDGVTKLTKSGAQTFITKEDQQAENLRKMFLAIANDVRVVIIKLTDRLHNMRTLEYCKTAKRVRKAKETLEVYAPLAHRFGMGAIKCELEDLSFMHLMPEEYEKLQNAIAPLQERRKELLQSAITIISAQLDKLGIQAEINGRPKHLYSIYRKMVKQNRPLEEIYDLLAIRVIVQTVNDCYAALGIIHSLWKPMPGRFKDYIAMPKPNMYRSLHTTLFGAEGIPFEVQIRTIDMHRTAEYGIAAHWMYKEGRSAQDELDSKLGWLRQALESEDDTESAKEFVDNIMKDFFSEYVFVLTPNGEILDLPTGSTPLDFAYRIHTNVGHHCQHAKVNGVMVRLDYKLKTNDVVEIITSANQPGPSRDWINIVKTQQAKVKIRQWFKKANREENIQKGREMLEDAAKRHGQQLSALMKQDYYADTLKRYNMSSVEDIYAAIGYGGISTGQILHKLLEQHRKTEKQQILEEKIKNLNEAQPGTAPAKPVQSGSRGIIVKGEPNMMVRFAQCCSPLPGDDIVGYITRGRGVSIHRSDCPNVGDLFREEDRMISVAWAENLRSTYTASIHITAADRPGVVMDITQLLLSFDISITSMNAKADKSGMVNVQMSFEVNNASQLSNVIKGIKKIRNITDVYRINS